jgi:hypothetical protein
MIRHILIGNISGLIDSHRGRPRRLTQRASDWWESARFIGSFLALVFSTSQAESKPAPLLTQAVTFSTTCDLVRTISDYLLSPTSGHSDLTI